MTSPSTSSPLRVAAVMTVFNRKEATLRCLRSVREQHRESIELAVFVVDDASTDGTSEAIASEFPEVTVLFGNGGLYWNGGMRVGLEAAYEGRYDFYWWLNDDVELDSDALDRLLAAEKALSERVGRPGIVVGSLTDPTDGSLTYGGVSRTQPMRRVSFTLVSPTDVPVLAETMNGNCVLVPAEIAAKLGNLCPQYRQKMGDYDYGLRVRHGGFQVWVAPGTYGTCARRRQDRNGTITLRDEVREMWSVKELPFGPWKLFCQRWSGPLWPLYFVSPYAKRSFRMLFERLRD